MGQFAGEAIDLYELIVQAMERGLTLDQLEQERKLGWGAEGARIRGLMNIQGMQPASAQVAAIPQPWAGAAPVFPA